MVFWGCLLLGKFCSDNPLRHHPPPPDPRLQESVYVITPCQPGTLTPGGAGDGGLFVKHLVGAIEQVRHLEAQALPCWCYCVVYTFPTN